MPGTPPRSIHGDHCHIYLRPRPGKRVSKIGQREGTGPAQAESSAAGGGWGTYSLNGRSSNTSIASKLSGESSFSHSGLSYSGLSYSGFNSAYAATAAAGAAGSPSPGANNGTAQHQQFPSLCTLGSNGVGPANGMVTPTPSPRTTQEVESAISSILPGFLGPASPVTSPVTSPAASGPVAGSPAASGSHALRRETEASMPRADVFAGLDARAPSYTSPESGDGAAPAANGNVATGHAPVMGSTGSTHGAPPPADVAGLQDMVYRLEGDNLVLSHRLQALSKENDLLKFKLLNNERKL